MAKRMKTRDVAFQFRMGSGFAGDVNRTHPASIEPVLIDASAPPTAYGQAVLVDPTTQGVRPFGVADTSGNPYGITVRPYPFQQSSATNYGAASIGAATPPVTGAMDVLRAGYIMAPVVGSPVKGGTVYIWTAATSGSHIQGGFEAVDPSTSGHALTNCTFNGGVDANGVAEIAFNI